MSIFDSKRVLESEAMALPEEVESYASMTTHPYLEAIDDSFVEHALQLGITSGTALDVGTGPGQLPMKICKQCEAVTFYAIDMSDAMLLTGASEAFRDGLDRRVIFQRGDGKEIPFEDQSFDHVICNSVVHHLEDPLVMLNEIARVVKPGGGILIRDLARPSRFMMPFHIRYFGRYYKGLFRRLYRDSVRAALTAEELESLLRQSDIEGASVFRRGRTHIGIAREAGAGPSHEQ